MPGNKAGGIKAAQKNKEKNPNYYRDLAYEAAKSRKARVDAGEEVAERGFGLQSPEKRAEWGHKGAESRWSKK